MTALLVAAACGFPSSLITSPMLRASPNDARLCSRASLARMCDASFIQNVQPDVTSVSAELSAELDAQQGKLDKLNDALDALWSNPPTIEGVDTDVMAYISERTSLVGTVDSSHLLNLDEQAGLWPLDKLPLGDSRTDKDMLWVDELSCIGCTWCADVARSTFKMIEPYGLARVVQQGGDSQDVIQEAIDCCPSDCIHPCTRADLELLEEHRSQGLTDDLLARGKATGGNWRDPIEHQGWRKGDKYIQSRRLRMKQPLLHQSGTATRMSVIGTSKVNEAPSPQPRQDGRVTLTAPTEETDAEPDRSAGNE